MRSTPFKTILRTCAQSQNVNPDGGSFTAQYAAELAESISNWIQELWTQEFWPFLLKTELRQFRPTYDATVTYAVGDERYYDESYYRSMADANLNTTPGTDEAKWMEVSEITDDDVDGYLWDPYLAWEQDDETIIPEDGIDLDEFLYYNNPVIESYARPVRDLREDEEGIHVVANTYPAQPWIRFRPRPPQFGFVAYSLVETCAKDDVRYDATTGECYRSVVDSNLAQALTNPLYWEKQLFPTVFYPVIRLYARADRLGAEEKYDAESRLLTRAAGLLDKLVNDFFEAGSRSTRARVKL